jgi:hypothetical protein
MSAAPGGGSGRGAKNTNRKKTQLCTDAIATATTCTTLYATAMLSILATLTTLTTTTKNAVAPARQVRAHSTRSRLFCPGFYFFWENTG